MGVKFIGGRVWDELHSLRTARGPAHVAVPYYSEGADARLKLKRDSTLVVKLDMATVQSGQVDPKEVLKSLKRGVHIHNCLNLHAKIYVFGSAALVGSANVSQTSENTWLEAAFVTRERTAVNNARRYVQSLTGDEITEEFAKSFVRHYRKPTWVGVPRTGKKRGQAIRGQPLHSPLYQVALELVSWDKATYDAKRRSTPRARKAISDRSRFELDGFQFTASKCPWPRGARLLQVTHVKGRHYLVSSPGRLLAVERYQSDGKPQLFVQVEVPKGRRRRALSKVRKALGPALARALPNPDKDARVQTRLLAPIGRYFA